MSRRSSLQAGHGTGSARKARPRWQLFATVGAAVVIVGAGLGVATAGTEPTGNTGGAAGAQAISCPTVADKLPAIPASAQAEVDRNLALLETQIAEANRRLATSAGQGGPNFVQNAILGPLADKRKSTIDRIAIAIGRQGTKPTGLDSLAACSLSTGGAVPEQPADPAAPADPAPEETAPADDGAAGAQAISCPTVADKLPAIPASAQAEVDRNLALLETQIAEANRRLATSAGQGGPNFVQNAILGPLEDKRVATINRIATAIGRQGTRPAGLEVLAPCTLANN